MNTLSTNTAIPIAIVIGGALIALGVFLSGSSPDERAAAGGEPLPAERSEHALIQGDPDAPIKIVEFSDFECPFCGRLHPTLERIVAESDGEIAWEYRHLPLPSHRNAEAAAYAGECIARLGGTDAFWDFADSAFASQRQFSTAFFEEEAERLGIERSAFRSCVTSDEIADAVATDRDAAISHGGRGTPFSVVVFPDGTTQEVSGALPYAQWEQLLSM